MADGTVDGSLRPKDGPVVSELEALEIVFAKDQPEYTPLRVLRSSAPHGNVLSRWTLTAQQRKLVAEGADIFLSVRTFGMHLQPVQMLVAHELDGQSVAEVLEIAIPIGQLPKGEI